MSRREARRRRIRLLAGTALPCLLVFLVTANLGWAGEPRDIVFECPCSAEWVAGAGGRGRLELSFGVRSLRPTESGSIDLQFRVLRDNQNPWDYVNYGNSTVGPVGGNGLVEGLRHVSPLEVPRPSGNEAVQIDLVESANLELDVFHETLTLWPVQDHGDTQRIRYVDLLTDADGDGVGDVNERIAGADPADPASTPGESMVDVLWLYDDGAPYGAQYTEIHHYKAVANAVLADNGTNIRLRTVGIARIEKTRSFGWPDSEYLTQLMDLHGADLTHQVGYSLRPCSWGCAVSVGGSRMRGLWAHFESFAASRASANTVLHELGHVMGLAHSARQGETFGAFRWSRGHYLNRRDGRRGNAGNSSPIGTIMTYARSTLRSGFSDPAADCFGEPCGVSGTEANGADARRTLDLMRFQVAAHRDAKPDSDGDGFVDDADYASDDPKEWVDTDGDGLGDNADTDDDGDGVDDTRDRWPFDPLEWEDLDGDGVGDNADDAVEVEGALHPFRDAVLRRAVEQALGKSPGEGISDEEMAGLQSLSAGNLGVRDLTGIELATGLKTLKARDNDVTDLSPLAGLTNLEHLDLSDNDISDLSPIAELTNLKSLWLGRNLISDLSPLAGLTNLESLWLGRNLISDLSPLAGLTDLETLALSLNYISDLSPLSGLAALIELELYWNRISDVTFLSGLSGLERLDLEQNSISNATALSGLHALRELLLTGNSIADLSPLQGLSNLEILGVGRNRVTDLSPLSGLTLLQDLRLDSNHVSDLSLLASLSALRRLWLGSNNVSDLSPLAGLAIRDLDLSYTDVSLDDIVALPGFPNIRRLGVEGLGISDVSSLAALSELELLSLDRNLVADISPLARREVWSSNGPLLTMYNNPLDEASITEHMPLLESWGVFVGHENSPAVDMPDARLRSLVAQATAGNRQIVDVAAVTRNRLERLTILNAFNAGISDLKGLEWATDLRDANLGSNSISDIGPLSNASLRRLNLNDNLVSDISVLVEMDELRLLDLGGNPLTEASLNGHIPALRDDGVHVDVESVEWEISASSEAERFEVKRYFESLLGPDLSFDAVGDDSALAAIDIIEGVLEVAPRGDSGVLTVTVTATDGTRTSATLRFRIAITFASDDHGNDRASATVLTIGGSVEAQIDYKGDQDWFRLELSDSASLSIYTTGSLDTVGNLLDESKRRIASDDNGGVDRNFLIEGKWTAGVYYLRVQSAQSGTGEYTLQAHRFADVTLDDAGVTVRLWASASGGWTLDPATGAPFVSGNEVVASNGDAYVLTLGSDGVWTASPAAGSCEPGLDRTIRTFAGTGAAGKTGDGGYATDARLNRPLAVAADAAGYVYVAGAGSHRIRRIGPDGVIDTFAGTGTIGFAGDGGPAKEARLNRPYDVAADAWGYVYVADRNNHRIRRIAPDGTISTIAGTGVAGYSGDGGPATAAQLRQPSGVAVDASGYVYVADTQNHRVRRIDAGGTIETIAGTGVPGFDGDGGPAIGARVSYPFRVAVDTSGVVYFADTDNHRIRRIDPDGTIGTIAGNGVKGYGGDGASAPAALLDEPAGVAVDGAGFLYIADWGNHRVRRVGPDGTVDTFAGTGRAGSDGDGAEASEAQLYFPAGVALGTDGQIYIAEFGGHRVRAVTLTNPCP